MEAIINEAYVREQLKLVLDPELGVNVVDLGLIYQIDVTEGDIAICMTLTTPGCPLHDTIVGGVRRVLEGKKGVNSVRVELVWEPRWSPGLMSEAAKDQLHFK